MVTIQTRALVSFSGACPLNCRHCYTFELEHKKHSTDSEEIADIVSSLRYTEPFDVIYISQSRENFVDEEAGVSLTEQLYDTYHKHVFAITRKGLKDLTIERLAKLSKTMESDGNLLVVAVSISANNSYSVTEDFNRVASPKDRCNLIKRLHAAGIKTVFMARPIFPDRIIPVREVINLITEYAASIDAVVASGLAVNEPILKRLNMKKETFQYLEGNNAEFLIGANAKDIMYIDVRNELKRIDECCKQKMIPFATHSMKALNMLLGNL